MIKQNEPIWAALLDAYLDAYLNETYEHVVPSVWLNKFGAHFCEDDSVVFDSDEQEIIFRLKYA